MKWVIGGLLLGFGSAVYSGRVPLAWVVYTFAAMFACWGLAMMFFFSRNKQYGLLLFGITYVSAAIAAVTLHHWWPLLAGFGIAWALRAMGLDPPPKELTDETVQAPPSGGDKV